MDRRQIRTKRNIKEAFFQLTKKKAINDITITELAELADIDRKTFYLHYSTVYDIILEFEEELTNELRNLFSSKKIISMEDLFHGFNDILHINMEVYRQIASASSIAFLQKDFKDIMKQEIKGAFLCRSKLEESKFMLYAEFCASGIVGVYNDWLANGNNSLEEMSEVASDAIENAWNRICSV